jgi:hypothetical protein
MAGVMRSLAARTVPLLVASLLPASLAAQPAPPKRLQVFVGSWTTIGTAQASPLGPAGRLTATESFEWMPGGFFLVHRWEGQQGEADVSGVEVLGFDARNKVFTSRFFDNAGLTGSLRASPQGNAWTWAGDADIGGKTVKQRCTTILVNPDTFTTRCEYSADGFKWLGSLESRSTRVK